MARFKRAVTDSETCVRFDPVNKKGISNLMTICSAATGMSFEQIEDQFAGKGYGDFKVFVGEAVVELLRPVKEETERLLKDKAYLNSVLDNGAQQASYLARRTLSKVYRKVGFYSTDK